MTNIKNFRKVKNVMLSKRHQSLWRWMRRHPGRDIAEYYRRSSDSIFGRNFLENKMFLRLHY